jgi:hypothetical protein
MTLKLAAVAPVRSLSLVRVVHQLDFKSCMKYASAPVCVDPLKNVCGGRVQVQAGLLKYQL